MSIAGRSSRREGLALDKCTRFAGRDGCRRSRIGLRCSLFVSHALFRKGEVARRVRKGLSTVPRGRGMSRGGIARHFFKLTNTRISSCYKSGGRFLKDCRKCKGPRNVIYNSLNSGADCGRGSYNTLSYGVALGTNRAEAVTFLLKVGPSSRTTRMVEYCRGPTPAMTRRLRTLGTS